MELITGILELTLIIFLGLSLVVGLYVTFKKSLLLGFVSLLFPILFIGVGAFQLIFKQNVFDRIK